MTSPAGCPDPDGDGFQQDKCPYDSEDFDGNEDHDGCPDLDNLDHDGDLIPDTEDACPKYRGPAHNRGCPEPDEDSDGMPDTSDACPKWRGPFENRGCPTPTGPKQ